MTDILESRLPATNHWQTLSHKSSLRTRIDLQILAVEVTPTTTRSWPRCHLKGDTRHRYRSLQTNKKRLIMHENLECVHWYVQFYRFICHGLTPSERWGSSYSLFSFMCMFCRSLFVLLSFFFWPLCCLFFGLRILITPLVFSNSSFKISMTTACSQIIDHID